MQILKVGELPKQKLYRGTCQHCGCQIQCFEDEVPATEPQPGTTLRLYPCPTKGCSYKIEMKEFKAGRKKEPKPDICCDHCNQPAGHATYRG